MDNNLTLFGVTYAMNYSDKDGSKRTNNGLGANMPRELRIAHMEAVDSKSKLATHRCLVRHDQAVVDGDGNILPLPASVYITVVYPKLGSSASVGAAITDGTIALRQIISPTAADAAALNLSSAIFTNHEQ
jgi:hypothetical protein